MGSTMSEPPTPHGIPNNDRLLHADDVAMMLGVPKTWVYAETRAGRIPDVMLGRYRRYRLAAVQEWIAAHERGPLSTRDNRADTNGRRHTLR
jgi:excisionase family DNA binding protein